MNSIAGLTLRQAALVAGFAYLLNPVSYAEYTLLPKLIVQGNAAQTVTNIAGHHGLFLGALFCYLINFTEDIVIAWALYVLLAPVNRALSLLAALLQLVYAAVAISATLNLAIVYRMVTTPEYLTLFPGGAFQAQVALLYHSFRYDFALALAIFALHLLLVGYLIIRSSFMPWWLGVLLILDGAGWLVNSLQPYLYPAAPLDWIFVTFFGELIFMLWLLIAGWRLKEPA